jgi:hypothetical protein
MAAAKVPRWDALHEAAQVPELTRSLHGICGGSPNHDQRSEAQNTNSPARDRRWRGSPQPWSGTTARMCPASTAAKWWDRCSGRKPSRYGPRNISRRRYRTIRARCRLTSRSRAWRSACLGTTRGSPPARLRVAIMSSSMSGLAIAALQRPLHLAQIPEQAGHQAQRLFRHRQKNVFIGRMLGAAGIGMRHPDRR